MYVADIVEGSVEKAYRRTGASHYILWLHVVGLWTTDDERPQDTGGS